MYDYLIVGAGLYGAVFAQEFYQQSGCQLSRGAVQSSV